MKKILFLSMLTSHVCSSAWDSSTDGWAREGRNGVISLFRWHIKITLACCRSMAASGSF